MGLKGKEFSIQQKEIFEEKRVLELEKFGD